MAKPNVEQGKRGNKMSEIALNLVVIRSTNLESSRHFYELLGLEFVRHRHGQGAEHLSADLNGVVFEIYPAQNDSSLSSQTRIGFKVTNLEVTSKLIIERGLGRIVSAIKPSPWGLRMVVEDPDGHKVELIG